jgi:hypothetical protein
MATAPGPPAPGLVTASSRSSPQAGIVAAVARSLAMSARCHMPTGPDTPEMVRARELGAEIVQHSPGHNSVIIARARDDAAARPDWRLIPFGMEDQAAVRATASQVGGIPEGVRRLVVPVGSGMSLAGILHGMVSARRVVPVLGVVVGADPTPRLDRHAPNGWRHMVELVQAGSDYHKPADRTRWWGIELDPYYEAKAASFVKPGDAFWVVGRRATAGQDSHPLHKAPPDDVHETWKISAAWLARHHECNLSGILARCGGSCCRTPSYWPPKVGRDSVCPLLGEKGCTLGDRRPVTCQLYPLVVNAHGTLVLHHRTTTKGSCCKGNHGHGPKLIDALGESLLRIFGAEAYSRIRGSVLAGRDCYESPLPWAIRAMRRERAWEVAGLPPEPLPD